MAYIAKHYIPNNKGMYTPGEIIREKLDNEDWLIQQGAIAPLSAQPMPIPENNMVEETNPGAMEEANFDTVEETEAVTEEFEAPEMDATDAIVHPEETEPPKRNRSRRAVDK